MVFDRNRSDDYARKPIAVELVLSDGTAFNGFLLIRFNEHFLQELNRENKFVEFSRANGELIVIAKSAIRSICPKEIAAADQLSGKLSELSSADPYAVLGVHKDADFEVVRETYLRLIKIYHPDRYASLELPKEIVDYVKAVTRRINLAYEKLESKMSSAA